LLLKNFENGTVWFEIILTDWKLTNIKSSKIKIAPIINFNFSSWCATHFPDDLKKQSLCARINPVNLRQSNFWHWAECNFNATVLVGWLAGVVIPRFISTFVANSDDLFYDLAPIKLWERQKPITSPAAPAPPPPFRIAAVCAFSSRAPPLFASTH